MFDASVIVLGAMGAAGVVLLLTMGLGKVFAWTCNVVTESHIMRDANESWKGTY